METEAEFGVKANPEVIVHDLQRKDRFSSQGPFLKIDLTILIIKRMDQCDTIQSYSIAKLAMERPYKIQDNYEVTRELA